MSFSGIGKKCLFSAISGVIMLDGKPAANARLKRIVGKAHTQGKKIDETTTDEKGYFEMPAIYDRSVISTVLPMEFSVPQQIFVFYQGIEYEMWSGVKRRPEENSESSGTPLIVQCELARESKMVSVGGGFVSSLCTWQYNEDPPIEFSPPEDDED